MDEFRVGIIGTGRPWKSEGATGFGMSHCHAKGYNESPYSRIVALSDLVREHAEAFKAIQGGDAIYEDYHEMLAKENLDIVSICTWPHLHAEMVIAAAEAGVRAIHCEKPMAPTWAEATRMVRACEEHGVQLTFNHQRRFSEQFIMARELLRAGAIGELRRLEGECSNLFDWGTHWFDMFHFYNDETPAEWVLGQIEPTGGKTYFGVPVEGQGLSHVKFRNGVHGLLLTGGEPEYGLATRLVGTAGVIEAAAGGETPLRVWGASGQDTPPIEQAPLGEVVARGVLDLVDALKTGREPELSAGRALRATELIFATYESSRRGGRVDLPLTIADSPLLARLEEERG